MSGKYRQFIKSKTCAWCGQVYSDDLGQHLAACPIRNAVKHAEECAGRALTFEEIRAVRDRARADV